MKILYKLDEYLKPENTLPEYIWHKTRIEKVYFPILRNHLTRFLFLTQITNNYPFLSPLLSKRTFLFFFLGENSTHSTGSTGF